MEPIRAELESFKKHVDDAGKAIDEGRSPQAAAETASGERNALQGRFHEARKKADELAAITPPASSAPTSTGDTAPAPVHPESDRANPDAAARDADHEPMNLAALEQKFDAVSERFDSVKRRIDAARQAFATLKQAIEAAGHAPLEGLDGGKPASQRIEVCAVGEALIDIRLPTEQFNIANHYQLRCERATTAADAGDAKASESAEKMPVPAARWETWVDVDQTDQKTGKNNPVALLGVISIESGTLVVTLNARRSENELGRAALCVAALQINSTLAGEGTPPPELTTHVQLAKPFVAGPIVLKQFLKAKRTQPHYSLTGLQQTFEGRVPDAGAELKWPIVAGFRGRFGGLEGISVQDRGGREKPLGWSMEWRWQDEPIVTTEFTILSQAQADSSHDRDVTVNVTRATLADAWATRERLVPLQNTPPDFCGMPTEEILQTQTEAVYAGALQPTIIELVTELPKVQGRKPTQVADELRKMLKDVPPQSLDEWRETLRVRLAATEGYRAWVDHAHPMPEPPQRDDGKPRHDMLDQAHRDAADANDQYVEEYRRDLEPRLQEPDCTELDAALIIRLRDRLAAIAEGKSKVRTLLADAGLLPDSTGPNATSEWPEARITGGCHIDFPSLGPDVRTVLVSFEERPADTSPEAESSDNAGHKDNPAEPQPPQAETDAESQSEEGTNIAPDASVKPDPTKTEGAAPGSPQGTRPVP